MTEQRFGSRPPHGLGDIMSLSEFEGELRRLAGYRVMNPVADPLAKVVNVIGDNPMFVQSRLLARILNGLTDQPVEFRRAEASAFDSGGLVLVIALLDAARAGTGGHEWTSAVSAANAAVAPLNGGAYVR